MRRWLSPLVLLGLCSGLLPGCDTLGGFGGTYGGKIIDGNFVRRCFPAGIEATLVFDPESVVADSEGNAPPSRLTTSDGAFQDTPLLPLSALPHDQLSLFDFPGPARVRNFLLFARPAEGPLAGRDAVVVVSMLEQGGLELRIMARTLDDAPECGSSATGDTATSGDGHEFFGVFQLKER